MNCPLQVALCPQPTGATHVALAEACAHVLGAGPPSPGDAVCIAPVAPDPGEVGWSQGEPLESAVDPWNDDSVADVELLPAKVSDSHSPGLAGLFPSVFFLFRFLFYILLFTLTHHSPHPPA